MSELDLTVLCDSSTSIQNVSYRNDPKSNTGNVNMQCNQRYSFSVDFLGPPNEANRGLLAAVRADIEFIDKSTKYSNCQQRTKVTNLFFIFIF
jgi:hypothetical protein